MGAGSIGCLFEDIVTVANKELRERFAELVVQFVSLLRLLSLQKVEQQLLLLLVSDAFADHACDLVKLTLELGHLVVKELLLDALVDTGLERRDPVTMFGAVPHVHLLALRLVLFLHAVQQCFRLKDVLLVGLATSLGFERGLF